jgi:glycosyltransferase involved in cell wall biosynthesis
MQYEPTEKGCDLAIIIPALNEEKGIANTIDSINSVLDSKFNYKIVVVDNISTDRTAEIAKLKGAIVIKQPLRGYGSALQKGFYYAEKKLQSLVTIMMDADGTYDPIDIEKMIESIRKDEADFVIGNRFLGINKNAMTKTNRVGNRILSSIARRLLKTKISDYLCGIRAFRTDLSSFFYNRAIGFSFATEMIAFTHTYRMRVKEIPVSYHGRIGDTKLFPYRDGITILGAIIRLMRDTRPLSFFGAIGAVMLIFGVYFGFEILFEWLETGTVIRIPTTILSVLLIMLGVQSISLGLLSDMIKEKERIEHLFFTD